MKHLFVIAIVVSQFLSFAQTPIQSNVIPKTFDQLIYQSAIPLSAIADSGSNAYWDFSGFPNIAGDTAIHEYINVPGTFKAKYPYATFSIKINEHGQTSYEMYDKLNDAVHYWGYFFSSQPITSVYTDASLEMKFPLTYGLSVTDNYTSKNYNPSDSNTVQGIRELKGIGYGRLKLPGNIIYDSVQLAYLLSTGTDNKGEKTKFESFEWYHPNYLGAIAVMKYNYQWSGTKWNLMTPGFRYQKRPQQAPALVGIKEVQLPKLEVFPNPGRNRIFMNSEENIERISITNILGTSVYEMVEVNNSSAELDISFLPNQLYIIIFQSKSGNMTSQRVVKMAD